MKYDNEKIHNIIDDAILHHMNEQPSLFNKPKEPVTKELMYSKSRKREVIICRQMNQYVTNFIFNDMLQKRLNMSQNGLRFGMDRTTLTHSFKTMPNLYSSDAQILNIVCNVIDSVIRRIKEGEGNKQAHKWYDWLYPQSNLFF